MSFGTYAAPLFALATTIVLAQTSAVTIAHDTVELDLLFPLNTTYAPSDFIPIVFAVQNSRAAEPLSLYISWRINILPTYDVVSSGTRDLTWTDFHNGNDAQDPYYVLFYAHNELNIEGRFRFLWDVSVGNCTLEDDGWLSNKSGFSRFSSTNGTQFTLQNGTQPPTLSASVGVCPIDVLVANITHIVNTTGRTDLEHRWGRDTCAALSVFPPKANPCGATLDGPTVANVMANVTRRACRERSLTTGCPPLTCDEMIATMAGCPESNVMAMSVPALGAGLVSWIWTGALASCILGTAAVMLQ